MTSGWIILLRNGLAVVALVLAVLVVTQGVKARALQDNVNDQREKLAQRQQVVAVDNAVVQIIAKVAVERNDPALKALLASNGITFNVNANTPAQGAAQ